MQSYFPTWVLDEKSPLIKNAVSSFETLFEEKAIVDKILDLRMQLRPVQHTEADAANDDQVTVNTVDPEAMSKLKALQAQLTELQGEQPLMFPTVDGQAIASVIAGWTGIPVGRMVKNEIEAVLNLGETLNKRVIGQRHRGRQRR